MGKPFEITYAPSQWDAPPGGIASQWSVPYGGLHVQFPENQIGPQYSPALNNVMFRNGELRTRPAFINYLPAPDGTNPILGIGSFLSKNQIWHTFCFTQNGLFQLRQGAVALAASGSNPWQALGGPLLSSGNPVAWRTFQSILYYTNGSGHLSAWDGSAASPLTDVAFTGNVYPLPNNYAGTLFSSLFLGELDNHILMANTVENGQSFPQRIRWSNIGFNPILNTFGGNLGTGGATFDPAVNINAGENDFLDVTDLITGMIFVGRVGLIFRQQGITEISPTGQGIAPFDFNHLWASEQGVGNVYPTTIAQYGSYGVFVATNDVYQATPSSIAPIGLQARDAIMYDLAQSAGIPAAAIVPSYAIQRVYLTYNLFIPLPNGSTRVYVYSFDDANWTSWTLSGVIAGQPTGCWTGDTVLTGTLVPSR